MDVEENRVRWPVKRRELCNHHMDSTRWNDFAFRPDDIVIATWAKSGTTWVQQVLGQLLFGCAEGLPIFDMSPWIEQRCFDRRMMYRKLEAQQHRRFVKTHLPVDALVFSPSAKYVYVGRDGRDVLWSWYNHHCNFSDALYRLVNNTPGRVGPPLGRPGPDVREYFLQWLDRDGFPLWPFWGNVRSWWEVRSLPNVLLLHFNELKKDLRAAIEKIARFLAIEVAGASWPALLRHCSFDYMKENAATLSPLLERALEGGARSFINAGTNSRWREMLTAADIERYERTAARELGPECAAWLQTGGGGAAPAALPCIDR